jgi:hypothetical protein
MENVMQVNINVGTDTLAAAQLHAEALAPVITIDGTFIVINIPDEATAEEAEATLDEAVASIQAVNATGIDFDMERLAGYVINAGRDIDGVYIARAKAAKNADVEEATLDLFTSLLHSDEHTSTQDEVLQLSDTVSEETECETEQKNVSDDGGNSGQSGVNQRRIKR